jgi:hypothetical protein
VVPLPRIPVGLTLQLLKLPAGKIEQDAGLKVTVPSNPLRAVIVRITVGELPPGEAIVTEDGFAPMEKSVPGRGVTISVVLPEESE